MRTARIRALWVEGVIEVFLDGDSLVGVDDRGVGYRRANYSIPLSTRAYA